MKKMNLSFSGLKIKMMLSLFLLIGLFFVSTNEVSAQSSKEYVEVVSEHIQALHMATSISMPITKSSKEILNNPRVSSDAKEALEKSYGEIIITQIENNGLESKEAIEKAYALLKAKIPVKYLDPVKETYLKML